MFVMSAQHAVFTCTTILFGGYPKNLETIYLASGFFTYDVVHSNFIS